MLQNGSSGENLEYSGIHSQNEQIKLYPYDLADQIITLRLTNYKAQTPAYSFMDSRYGQPKMGSTATVDYSLAWFFSSQYIAPR